MRDSNRYHTAARLGEGAETGDSKRPSSGGDCLDAVYSILSVRRRRDLLYALESCEPPVPLADVADRLIEWEYGVPAEAMPNERLRVYMSLYHEHVPKLEEHDVVAYDQETDTLVHGSNAARLRPHLEYENRALVTEGTPTE